MIFQEDNILLYFYFVYYFSQYEFAVFFTYGKILFLFFTFLSRQLLIMIINNYFYTVYFNLYNIYNTYYFTVLTSLFMILILWIFILYFQLKL